MCQLPPVLPHTAGDADYCDKGAVTPSTYGGGDYQNMLFMSNEGKPAIEERSWKQVIIGAEVCGRGSGGGPGHTMTEQGISHVDEEVSPPSATGSVCGTGSGGGPGVPNAAASERDRAGRALVTAYGEVSKKARKRARQQRQTEDTFRRAWDKLPTDLRGRVSNGELDVVHALDLLVARY
jgi:hypothetical protein